MFTGGSAVADEVSALAAPGFRNPVNAGADPFMTYANGEYVVGTTQGGSIRLWHSPSITTLFNSAPITVWTDSDPSRNAGMWAPAFYRLSGPNGVRWYLYYTATNRDGAGNEVDDNHRMYVLESAGDSPLGPYTFKAKVAVPGADLWAIDGEPFVHNGQLYFSWSGAFVNSAGTLVKNRLYLAAMSNPWTITGGRTAFAASGGCTNVREGPTPLRNAGRLYLTYSACDTGLPDYQLWMKSIPDGADPLVDANWTQHAGPIFQRNDAAGVWGPGHHSFFRSPDGTETWIAYHAKNTSAYTYSWRTSRVQKIGFNADGSPNLGVPFGLGETIPLPTGDPGPSADPAVGTRVINDFDIGSGDFQVSYTGIWSSGSGCGAQCYQGDDHWNGTAGATATFRFTGTQIALFSVRDVGNGIAAISVDGGPPVDVDFYGSPRVGQEFQYLSPQLAAGPHTLTVTVTGRKIPASSSTVISIDRAEIWP